MVFVDSAVNYKGFGVGAGDCGSDVGADVVPYFIDFRLCDVW